MIRNINHKVDIFLLHTPLTILENKSKMYLFDEVHKLSI